MIMLHACARLTSRAYDMNGAGVRCFRTVMISPALLWWVRDRSSRWPLKMLGLRDNHVGPWSKAND
jgi:hypothetical protein